MGRGSAFRSWSARRCQRSQARFRYLTGKRGLDKRGLIVEALEDRLSPSVTPAHLYAFDGNFNDAQGGPAIVADGGTLSGGRYVFGPDLGLRLTGGLANTSNYSVAMTLSLNSLAQSFNKIIDFQGRSSDNDG